MIKSLNKYYLMLSIKPPEERNGSKSLLYKIDEFESLTIY